MDNHLITRRDLLKRAALLPFAAALGTLPSTDSLALEPIHRVGAAHLRPGLNAYSFLELLNANAKDASKGVDLFGVCDFAATQDFDAVDLTGYFFPGYPKPPTDTYVNRLKRHAHNLGLDISGTGVSNDFTAADKTVRATGVESIKGWIEVAARLGAPSVRVFADARDPFKKWQDASNNATREDVEVWMAEALHGCAEHGEKFGVVVAVQNHGDFITSGTEHLALLQRVGQDWCRALVDTGKYMTDDPYADIALMVPHAVNWQIKETLRSRTDSPRTDFRKLVKIICDGGYRGYLPIETLSMRRKDYDPFVEVAKVLAELREAIAGTPSH
jgi:sugar phosphate isomerase/epimerase